MPIKNATLIEHEYHYTFCPYCESAVDHIMGVGVVECSECNKKFNAVTGD